MYSAKEQKKIIVEQTAALEDWAEAKKGTKKQKQKRRELSSILKKCIEIGSVSFSRKMLRQHSSKTHSKLWCSEVLAKTVELTVEECQGFFTCDGRIKTNG